MENEFDILLRKELAGENSNEAIIRDLVTRGADIAGDFLIDAIFCYTCREEGSVSLNLKFFNLFIELGADVNYEDDGFNCLYEASLSWNPQLVELFIDAGANVNCINTDSHESLLDAVIFELHHEEQRDSSGAEPLGVIVDILKRNGAKYTTELVC